MDATFAFTVNSKQANRPLLQCLLPVIPYLRIDQWRSLLKPDSADGIIRVDGRIVHENIVLLSGQQVSYTPCYAWWKRGWYGNTQLAHLGHPIIGDKIYSNQGEYYLKRLAKTLSAQDDEGLLTPHHLLHAYKIHLFDLWAGENKETQEIILYDDDFPESWQGFAF